MIGTLELLARCEIFAFSCNTLEVIRVVLKAFALLDQGEIGFPREKKPGLPVSCLVRIREAG